MTSQTNQANSELHRDGSKLVFLNARLNAVW